MRGNAVALPLVLALVVVAACGPPQSLEKQAEEVASVAAEGSILAHDAAEGDTTAAFTRVHGEALKQKLAEVQTVIEDRPLAAVAASVSQDLETLAASPGDRRSAVLLERRLARSAERADHIAKK